MEKLLKIIPFTLICFVPDAQVEMEILIAELVQGLPIYRRSMKRQADSCHKFVISLQKHI